jgi:hypothetical protein
MKRAFQQKEIEDFPKSQVSKKCQPGDPPVFHFGKYGIKEGRSKRKIRIARGERIDGLRLESLFLNLKPTSHEAYPNCFSDSDLDFSFRLWQKKPNL